MSNAPIADEEAIRAEVYGRKVQVEATQDWLTPAGRPRSVPLYYATIRNQYLDQQKTIKCKDPDDFRNKINSQIEKWNEQEISDRVSKLKQELKQNRKSFAAAEDQRARDYIDALRGILAATLPVNDQLQWDELYDRREYQPFIFHDQPALVAPPPLPGHPPKPFFSFLFKSLIRKWEEHCRLIDDNNKALITRIDQENNAALAKWENERKQALNNYSHMRNAFLTEQKKRNDSITSFRQRFESGEPAAIIEYLNAVFERSVYPEGILIDQRVAFEPKTQTVEVDLALPIQNSIVTVVGYKCSPKDEILPVEMKKKDHDELYDNIIKQIVIRTIHEVFESVYTPHVQAVVANGWVTYLNKATGNEETSCIISVSTERKLFETFRLSHIDVTECIKKMKGIVAGPLSNIIPVRPLLQLDRKDKRFIEGREVLADYHSTTNLAEIPWEDFEHLVRELFEKMFVGEGVEVKVTQASRDQGVDAVIFDPDPIRGGKFVIQAKRYTQVVPVSAVRDLYGAMMNEGAVKGIIVTTSHYGRDSMEFAKDKPLTLIDGSNLVYLLEQHGHKVRIDVKEARSKMAR